MRRTLALMLLVAPVCGPAMARRGCVEAQGSAPVTLTGRLSLIDFPGRPNYTSIAQGDEDERTFVLTLSSPICVDDKEEFADPARRFRRVQISYADTKMLPVLRAAVGHRVTVSGPAQAALDGHYHEPLAIFADRVSAASGPSRSR